MIFDGASAYKYGVIHLIKLGLSEPAPKSAAARNSQWDHGLQPERSP